MYIIAIAWLYVAVLMAATEGNVLAGIFTFITYGLLPLALLLWVLGSRGRRRRRSASDQVIDQVVSPLDRRDP